MRSAAVLAFLAVAVVGLGLLVAAAIRDDDRDLAFTISVTPDIVAAEIPPGREACQTPVNAAERFDGIQFQVGTYHRPGPPLDVLVRELPSRRRIASGRLAGGYPDVARPIVAIDPPVPSGAHVAVCIRNRGTRRVALYGGPELARPLSTATLAGRDLDSDLTLIFTKRPTSALATAPDVFERASLFRPVWIGPWAYWLLAGLLLLAAPALLARALRDAFAVSDGSASDGGAAGQRERRP